jgi:hypothetical protein
MALADRQTDFGSTKQYRRSSHMRNFQMQRISCKELQPAQTVSSSPARRRRGVLAGRLALVFAVALTVFVVRQPAIAAVCHVPATLLCQGCVERLSIRVTPDGACRISFASPAATPDAAEAGKFVDINVEAGSPRPLRRRASTPRLSDARPASPLRRPAACFVFNGRHFCE